MFVQAVLLVVALLFLLISLLAVLRAPTNRLWLLSVIVTEYPLVFASINLLLVIASGNTLNTLLSATALLLSVTPILRAYIVSRQLKQHFPGTPFRFSKLFSLGRVPKVSCRTLTYINELQLDFYPCSSSHEGRKPCVIVVHGGAWCSGSRRAMPELNSILSRQGYHVAAISYRLAPTHTCPAPIEDLHASLIYLKEHADELHIDSNKFVLLGRSAGAQIVLLAAYTLNNPSVKGVVNFYGPADMISGHLNPTNPLILNSTKVLEDYVGGSYDQVPDKYAASSPIEFVNERTTPTLSIHGGKDELVSIKHAHKLQKKLQQYGVQNYVLDLPWATHGFDFNIHGPGGQLATYAIVRFLDSVTK